MHIANRGRLLWLGVLGVVVSLGMLGCESGSTADDGSPLTAAMYNAIQPQMTHAQVVSIIGRNEDSSQSSMSNQTTSTWYYDNGDSDQTINVTFQNGLAISKNCNNLPDDGGILLTDDDGIFYDDPWLGDGDFDMGGGADFDS